MHGALEDKEEQRGSGLGRGDVVEAAGENAPEGVMTEVEQEIGFVAPVGLTGEEQGQATENAKENHAGNGDGEEAVPAIGGRDAEGGGEYCGGSGSGHGRQ